MEQELGIDPPPREWSDDSSAGNDNDDDGEGEVVEKSATAVNKRRQTYPSFLVHRQTDHELCFFCSAGEEAADAVGIQLFHQVRNLPTFFL